MEYLRYIVYATALAGAIIVFFNRKKLTPAFHWTGWFLLFAALSQISGYLLFRYVGNNISFYNGALLINFVLLYLILRNLSKQLSYRKKLNLVFGLSAIGIIYFSTPDFFDSFASRALTVLNASIFIGCLLYLYEMLKVPEKKPLTKQGHFWIAAALLVHHVSVFTHWMLFELFSGTNNNLILSLIIPVVTIILYFMLIIATFIQLKHPNNDRSDRAKRR